MTSKTTELSTFRSTAPRLVGPVTHVPGPKFPWAPPEVTIISAAGRTGGGFAPGTEGGFTHTLDTLSMSYLS